MGWILVIGVIAFIGWLFYSAKNPSKGERNATRTCAHCGSTIPFTARVCPYCRNAPGSDWRSEGKVYGRQHLKGLKWTFILVIIIVLVVVLGNKLGIDFSKLFGR